MKKYLILFLLLGLSSCDKDSKEDSIPLNASKIIGSWQIVSESYSIGGPQISVTVKNGGIYNFRLDGTFAFTYAKDASLNHSGTFKYEDEALTLNYVSDDEEAYRDLKVSFENDLVTWFPIGPTICIEGCSTTLQRID